MASLAVTLNDCSILVGGSIPEDPDDYIYG